MEEKVDKDLVLFKSKFNGQLDQPSPYKTYITKTVPMLENLTGFYKQADGQTKKKILGCIFSEKLVFEKRELQPSPSRNPYRFCSRFPRCYKDLKIKKRLKITSCLLWLPRLPEYSGEPATHGLIPSTRDCSNQLLSFSSPSKMKDHHSIL